jgi:hypothetical protein
MLLGVYILCEKVFIPTEYDRKNTKKGFKPTKKGEKMSLKEENNAIRQEMDSVIKELEKMGINQNAHKNKDVTGLGDVVESVLKSVGITEERFRAWFNLKECNCSKRKAYLNNLFSWKKTQG